MPRLDERSGCLAFKIVLWGPGQSGKTTALRSLHATTPADRRGDLVCLSLETQRTVFFDFFPIYAGKAEESEQRIRLDLFTVPGQVFYEEARQIVLRDADGVVIVADSGQGTENANRAASAELQAALARRGEQVPAVVLYNKRDAPDCVPLDRLREWVNTGGHPEFEGVATRGVGLTEALGELCDLVLERHRRPTGGNR